MRSSDVQLTWSGSSPDSATVLRDGAPIARVQYAAGAFRDRELPRGLYVYQLCDAMNAHCSNEASARVK